MRYDFQVFKQAVRKRSGVLHNTGDKARILEGVKKLGYEVVEIDADGKKVGAKNTF